MILSYKNNNKGWPVSHLLFLSCILFFQSTHSFQATTLPTTSRRFHLALSATPFEKACAGFEEAHKEDPRTIVVDGETLPYSVHYHRRMAHWLDQLAPDDCPEEVKLTARCQHIRRWTRPRTDYPKGLKGYKKWRADMKVFHSEQAAEILLDAGYSTAVADRVGQLLGKENLATDPDVQLLEDVICVVFLENEYTSFIEQDEYATASADDKLVGIVQKTWKKMTPRGHEAALKLAGDLTPRGLRVVETALETAE